MAIESKAAEQESDGTMRVYLFSDYLKQIRSGSLSDDQIICEIKPITEMPEGLCEINGRIAKLCMFDRSNGQAFIEYIDSMPKNDEVLHSDNITCPYCGNEDKDSWEAGDSEDEYLCEDCGSVYSYERHIEITYTSRMVRLNEDIVKLHLKPTTTAQ